MTEEAEIVELARDRLLAYCSLINESYDIPNHIRRLAEALERVESGEIKRLIVTIPPRHGKSMLCSQYFPAWYLGKNPDRYIITTTYGQELSDGFGRRVREQLLDPYFKMVFPHSVVRDNVSAANRLETTKNGSYFAVGVGGAITGRGAHLLMIDDPIKGREEAESSTMRDKLIDWYRSVAYTRLMPNAAVVVVMTRWHEQDLVGWLKHEQGHENWTVIDLPALDEESNIALWPERYSIDDLMRIKATLDEYDWQCLYQQNPMPREGIIFKSEWLKSGFADEYATKFIAVDPAISKRETSDETAICVIGIPFGDNPTWDEIETVHGHFDFNEQIQMIKVLNAKHKPVAIGVESVAYQKALAQVLIKEGLPVRELKADTDKIRRGMSISHHFSQGRVRVNTPKVRSQLLSFRGGNEKNDLADAMIHCVKLVQDCSSSAYIKPEPERLLTYDERVQRWLDKKREQSRRARDGNGSDPTLGGKW